LGLTELPVTGRVYVDSQIVIYLVEEHPDYLRRVKPLWERAESGEIALITSALAVMECLVIPYRLSDAERAKDYEYGFFHSEIETVEVDLNILRRAAQLRATSPGLRTPDAIHVATAFEAQCSYIVTNDLHINAFPDLSVVYLQDVS